MSLRKVSVSWQEIGEENAGQRVDNYLLATLKGVPKSHVYRILRSGEVRVNSARVQATYRLQAGDRVRIPPYHGTAPALESPLQAPRHFARNRMGATILFEDEALLVLNKPAGWAVHGGSGIQLGVIEQLRLERPQSKFLELVHRLDRETSGLLLVAKKRQALRLLHEQMRAGGLDKRYLALAQGAFPAGHQRVTLDLYKFLNAQGERRVQVQAGGKPAETIFNPLQAYPGATLVQARLVTGRTHQIRVHLAHLGHPIAGDDKYGDFAWNKTLQTLGLKRMFLHAQSLRLRHPLLDTPLELHAPLPPPLEDFLQRLARGTLGSSLPLTSSFT